MNKSQYDIRNYRAIKLNNQMDVILVNDHEATQ